MTTTTWTASYRGGWQTVLPNAGNACDVGGEHHGFHGSASIDAWTASETTDVSTVLAWSGHGLHVEKRISLEDGALAVRYRIANTTDEPVPLVALSTSRWGSRSCIPPCGSPSRRRGPTS